MVRLDFPFTFVLFMLFKLCVEFLFGNGDQSFSKFLESLEWGWNSVSFK